MPRYVDFHRELMHMPALPPSEVKPIMDRIKAGEADEFGVKHINIIFTKDGHGFCLADAPSVEALLASHKAKGLPLEASDVHHVIQTLAEFHRMADVGDGRA